LMALTEYPQALEELQAFDRTAPSDLKQRVPGLPKIIADLRTRVTTVSIGCDVAGARLRLRDRTIGACPLAAPVTVNAGRGTLEGETGILGKWWFWTGVGVVVAGGVAVVIAVSTEKSPDKGTVQPGVVVGGLHGAGFRF